MTIDLYKRRLSKMSRTFPVDAKLKDGSLAQLMLADERDVELLRRLY